MLKIVNIIVLLITCLCLAVESSISQTSYLTGLPDTILLKVKTGEHLRRTIQVHNNDTSTIFFSISGDHKIDNKKQDFALNLDGIDDYVDCGNLGLGAKVREITIECWINANNIEKDQGSWEFFGNTLAEFRLGIFSGSFSIMAKREHEDGWIYYMASPPGNWVHTAVSFDGHFIKMYKNGKLLGSTPLEGSLDLDRLFYIGTKDQKDDYFDGVIDEVRVWNIVRSELEIMMDMNRELSGTENGFIGYWNFNEGEGDQAKDLTFPANDGQLFNRPSRIVSTASIKPFQWWDVSPAQGSVNPGAIQNIKFEFYADELEDGNYFTDIIIALSGHKDSVVEIPVCMQVKNAPDIAFATDTLFFSNVNYGNKYIGKVEIINKGFQPLKIDKVVSDNRVFKIKSGNIIIEPRSSFLANVIFKPSLLKSSNGKLLISSNDPDQPDHIIILTSEPLQIERKYIIQWMLYITLIFIIIIVFLLYFRYRLKLSLNRQLKLKIDEALMKLQAQKQIIVHQSRLTSLGEMAAGIAHEINVPLQNILFAAENIESQENKKVPDRDKVANAVYGIEVDSDKIVSLLDHIKTFSGGKKSEVTTEISVNEIIQNILSMTRVKMVRQKIKLNLDIDEDLPLLKGDPYKLEQVLINIISNARDALNEKALLINGTYSKEIKIRTSHNIEALILEIEDNGTGISEENLPKIFNPFFTTKKIGQGTGLGLSISYGLIRDMNGTIDVTTNLNQGTKFKLSFLI